MISDKVRDLVTSAITTSGRRLSRLERNGLMVELQEKVAINQSLSDSDITRMALEIIDSSLGEPARKTEGAKDHLGRPIESSRLNQRLLELSNLISVPDETERVKAMWELRQLLTRNRKIL